MDAVILLVNIDGRSTCCCVETAALRELQHDNDMMHESGCLVQVCQLFIYGGGTRQWTIRQAAPYIYSHSNWVTYEDQYSLHEKVRNGSVWWHYVISDSLFMYNKCD